jgi:hypothetical protein
VGDHLELVQERQPVRRQRPVGVQGLRQPSAGRPTPPGFLAAGANWTTVTGSSSLPLLTVPSYMLALVTGKVTQTSSTVTSGSVLHWVIIKTYAGG